MAIPLSAVVLMIVNIFALNHMNTQFEQLKVQREVITETKEKLNETNKSLDRIKEEKNKSDTSLREQREKAEKLEKENQSLKVNLQAKREAQAAQTVAQTKQVTQKKQTVAVAASGTCADWLAAAGVTDMANAQELIRRESGCNPHAVNPSSGACGIGQQLPCGKWEHAWNDPVGSIIDMQKYVIGRYGSWANAVSWHNQHGWY